MPELVSFRCPNCGAPVHTGDTTCEYCGAALYIGRPTEVALPAVAEAQKIAAQMRERIAANSYDGDAYYQLGLACFTLKLYEQAENAFRQAQRFIPGGALPHYFAALSILYGAENDILSLGEFRLRTIQNELVWAFKIEPNLAEAQGYLQLVNGLIARDGGDYQGAITPLCQAVELMPRLAFGWKALAACYFQIGNYNQAIHAGIHLIALRPDDEGTVYLVGAAHDRLGETDKMEQYARRVAQLRGDPESWSRVVEEYHGVFERAP